MPVLYMYVCAIVQSTVGCLGLWDELYMWHVTRDYFVAKGDYVLLTYLFGWICYSWCVAFLNSLHTKCRISCKHERFMSFKSSK